LLDRTRTGTEGPVRVFLCLQNLSHPGALIRAAQNDELLVMAGVDLEAVEFRLSCTPSSW